MRLTRLRIENFRSIRQLDLELGGTTVFIGPNNAGKTAILDAVRIALTRRWGQRGTGFTEYDVHLGEATDDPKDSPGVSIELRAEDSTDGNWPDALLQDLNDIIQLDPRSGRKCILLRVTCAWNEADACYQPSWEFLNAARAPLAGRSARRMNLERFWRYVPVFYLDALRDANDEFSPRSQFWGRLLQAMEIPKDLEFPCATRPGCSESEAPASRPTPWRDREHAFRSNASRGPRPRRQRRLAARPPQAVGYPVEGGDHPAQRAGLALAAVATARSGRPESIGHVSVPGVVEHLLAELYEEDSAPLLALEEPETHLHPQAARTLWSPVADLPGQKLITTHSPYFVQHVPFRDIRIVRLTDQGTVVQWLPPSFSTQLPHVAELDAVTSRSNGLLEFDHPTGSLTVHGRLSKTHYRELLTCYGTHEDRAKIHEGLRDLRDRSLLFISDVELSQLETFARRIRGEIFFASRWMIVEGQAEHLLVHSFARALGYDLDEHGVALIDAVNNGNPALFAALARALDITWTAVFDGDDAGRKYIVSISRRNFDSAFIDNHCRIHPAGPLENQLLADGLEPELRSILNKLGQRDSGTIDGTELRKRLNRDKIPVATELAKRLREEVALAQRMPQAFRDAIADLRGLG